MDKLLYANPDQVLHPGEHVRDFLEAQELSQSEFAERAGFSEKHVSQIVTGKAGISAEMALALERIVGGGATMWINLDAGYRLWCARQDRRDEEESRVEWVADFPLSDLRKRGYLKSRRLGPDAVCEVLAFFGVANRERWERVYGTLGAQYRQSPAYSASAKAQASYVRICELRAQVWDLPVYDAEAFRVALDQIRGRLSEPPLGLLEAAGSILRDTGVALVLEPGMAKARLSGAAFWPRRNRPVLALTDRFKTADHLWFSFFHEAGHLLLHRDRSVLEVDGKMGDLEAEADGFAREMLLPESAYRALTSAREISLRDIAAVAGEHRLPVDSLVGMLQHDGFLPHTAHRDLKRAVRFG